MGARSVLEDGDNGRCQYNPWRGWQSAPSLGPGKGAVCADVTSAA